MSIQSECFALNIKKSEAARSSICRGLSLAENPFTLLIIAIRCIAEMSGDMSFIPMCEKAMKDIYGVGLHNEEYTAHRIAELEQGIEKLTESIRTCSDYSTRERLCFAVRLQREELKKLKKDNKSIKSADL